MRLGQTVPHQHQALPLTKESLADHSINFLNYTADLNFAYNGQVYNALTVLSLSSVFDLTCIAYVPNVVGRPTKVLNQDLPELRAEAYLVYVKACEAYLAAEEALKVKVIQAMQVTKTEDEDED